MCGYKLNIDRNDPKLRAEYPSYNGDRIIVNKFAYDLSDPKRWDVVVFKYPEDCAGELHQAIGRFAERAVPHCARRYLHGSVGFARFQRDAKIARKSPEKLRAMLQPVYDNDYVGAEDDRSRAPSRAGNRGPRRRSEPVGHECRFQIVHRRKCRRRRCRGFAIKTLFRLRINCQRKVDAVPS